MPARRTDLEQPSPAVPAHEHPRTIGWFGTTALAMGGSNQSLFLIGALVIGQGSAAIPILVVGLILSWFAVFGWTELILMWPNRVGGIAGTCAEAFRPYSSVLANLTGVCYWWGWVPTCGLTAILSASALHQFFLPGVDVTALAVGIVTVFTAVNLCGVRWATRLAIPFAIASGVLAFGSALIPIFAGTVDWHRASTFHLQTPFSGTFGALTSAMAGLYLVGFAAPAFEAASCHVGETRDAVRNVPRAMFAAAGMATLYFLVLPVVWLGALGAGPLGGDLAQSLSPTYRPLFGSLAAAAAIWFMTFNMFHGTLQPLAGAARTLSQLADDGLLPRTFGRRNRFDAPWVTSSLTAASAIVFLLVGDPTWLIAAANFTYLIGVCLPSIAVWLLRRDQPERDRPYRAPRGTITLGVIAAAVWLASTLLGFEQFGLPTVILGLGLAYAGSGLYAWRCIMDRRARGERVQFNSLHTKLTGAMLLVMALDGAGYLLALSSIAPSAEKDVLDTVLKDVFVAVALLTISVGLVLPGMIAHAVTEIAHGAERLATGTLADLSRAMEALAVGDIDAARARPEQDRVTVHSGDELGWMARSFNTMQDEAVKTARSLDRAREGLRQAKLELVRANSELEARVTRRTAQLQKAHDELRALATTDHLTGLPNHRSLVTAIDQEIDNGHGRPFSIMFVDIDHFKALNDSLGHAAGDAALQQTAELLCQSLRGSDIVGRHGGEEFVCVLSATAATGAMEAAEAVRGTVAEHRFDIAGGAHLTCSIGISTYPENGATRGDLVSAADRAMYAAKHLGRNQVLHVSDPAVSAVDDSDGDGRDRAALQGMVEALALVVKSRDMYSGDDADRVAMLAARLAAEMGLGAAEAEAVGIAGRLHDVGKVAVPDSILRKPGRLTSAELGIVQTHPAVGADVVSRIPGLQALVPIIRHHHECWDGTGYPDRISGPAIPVGARIIAVADAYGAMTTTRAYREALSPEWAMGEVRRGAGSQFDPAVVRAMERVIAAGESEADRKAA